MHTPLLVETELGTLLFMENQNPLIGLENQPKSSQDVYLLHMYHHLLLFCISNHQLVGIYLYYPLVMLLLILTVFDDNLPIALCNDKHTCAFHSIYRFVSYSHLRSSFHAFISDTWGLVVRPPVKKVVGCRCVYTLKLNFDKSVIRLKALFGYQKVFSGV